MRKNFFFEKKKQKTFAPGDMGVFTHEASGQKSFAEPRAGRLFFRKATAYLPVL
jgi:hypothetical protein